MQPAREQSINWENQKSFNIGPTREIYLICFRRDLSLYTKCFTIIVLFDPSVELCAVVVAAATTIRWRRRKVSYQRAYVYVLVA